MAISVNSIRDQVADLVGGDENAQEFAVKLINRAIDHLNMNGIILINRKEKTWTSAAGDFTTGTQSLALPSDYGWPNDRLWAYDSNDNLIQIIEYRPWETFKSAIGQATSNTQNSNVPEVASIMAPYSDNRLYFWPYFDSTKVAKVVFPYFRRYTTVIENGDLPDDCRDIAEAINCYAQFLLMQYRFKDKPAIWKPWEDYGELALRKAKNSQHRHELGASGWHVSAQPDESGRIGTPFSFLPRGATYILISGT